MHTHIHILYLLGSVVLRVAGLSTLAGMNVEYIHIYMYIYIYVYIYLHG